MSEFMVCPTIRTIEKTGKNITVHRAPYNQGFIYKSWEAFYKGKGICYVPELSDSLYTKQDFMDLCNGQEEIAQRIFEDVDWQHPETYIEEEFMEGELDECESCKKWYFAYNVTTCPYCGHVNGENM